MAATSTDINPNLTGPILLQRIPSWPYADPKGRHIVVPGDKLAYVEIGGGVAGQVGFRH